MMKLVLLGAVALLALVGAVSGQQTPQQLRSHTVLAKTMTTAKLVTKLVPPPPPLRDDEDEEGFPVDDEVDVPRKPRKAKAAAAGKKSLKSKKSTKKAVTRKAKKAQKKAAAKIAALDNKKNAKKLQPGEASKLAAAAVKSAKKAAPKDQLMRWIRKNSVGASEAALKKIEVYLNGQMIHTFEDLLSKGEDGIRALLVGEEWRSKFMDLLLAHIGKTRGVDDGMLVPTEALKKGYNPKAPKEKKPCKHGDARQPQPAPTGAARFLAIPVNNAAPSPVGAWLRAAFPDAKPLRMSRSILALERQNIRTFADLRRVGVAGVKRLLYVPDGVREALYEAVISHIGTEGHDDGKPVTATRYVAPKPVKETCN